VLSLALRLTVSLSLLALLGLVVAEPRDLIGRIGGMDGVLLIGALALTAADRMLMAYKWRLLLRARGNAISLWTAVRAYFASSFAGLFLPVTLGADAVRIMATRRFGIADITASIVVERSLGAVAVAIVALGGCGIMAGALAAVALTPIVVAIAAVGLGAGVAILLSLWLTSRWVQRQAVQAGPFAGIVRAYAAYADHPGTLATFLGLSIGESLVPAIVAWVVARGLGLDAPIWLFVAAVPIALMVARLPVSLGGFGVQETAFVYLAGLLGLGASDAVATMLVVDAVLVATLLPAAFDVSILGHERPAT
jgi:uncharacterized membrane protein YbhN (UPF0104 family)